MNKACKEFISPDGEYKSVITEESNSFHIDVYILGIEFDPDANEIYPCWEKINHLPIIVEKEYTPGFYPIEELKSHLGDQDFTLKIDLLRDFPLYREVSFLNPKEVNVYSEVSNAETQEVQSYRMDANKIIYICGLCLVEEINDEGNWQMGQMDKDGNISCWSACSTFKEAIRGF